MPAAATIGSGHRCPLSDGPKPHQGGRLLGPGAPTILIDGKIAAVVGDVCLCKSPVPNAVARGSSSVLLSGRPAARKGDSTAHGGALSDGVDSVLIG
jgi:uncharacterized Zn-binding protein involved in type VI secretion